MGLRYDTIDKLERGYFDSRGFFPDMMCLRLEADDLKHYADELRHRLHPPTKAAWGIGRRKSAANRLDIEAVRQAADFRAILERYGLKGRVRGERFMGSCPWHEDRRPSFSANLAKKVFYCFSCGEKGSVFDFIMKMEGCDFLSAVRLCQ